MRFYYLDHYPALLLRRRMRRRILRRRRWLRQQQLPVDHLTALLLRRMGRQRLRKFLLLIFRTACPLSRRSKTTVCLEYLKRGLQKQAPLLFIFSGILCFFLPSPVPCPDLSSCEYILHPVHTHCCHLSLIFLSLFIS